VVYHYLKDLFIREVKVIQLIKHRVNAIEIDEKRRKGGYLNIELEGLRKPDLVQKGGTKGRIDISQVLLRCETHSGNAQECYRVFGELNELELF
jgi:hypothetical protein